MGGISAYQEALATLDQSGHLSVMGRGRSEQLEGTLIMLLIVPVKDLSDLASDFLIVTQDWLAETVKANP